MRNSEVWRGYEEGRLQGIILADSGYALRPWLMTPFGAPNTLARARYNRALCRNRVLVEQVIGRWKRRFHALHGELRISLDRVPQFIMAAAVLHNICKMRNEPDVDDEEFDDDQPDQEHLCETVSTGANTRDHIVNNYFSR
ncbi:DDE superfamily endonuclease domain-containing protein [Ditylenchus destructor]|nr:DDE superfamily endonuclease domain-containing protein [Ditylenchus destructor]